jgi:hypothetical protein
MRQRFVREIGVAVVCAVAYSSCGSQPITTTVSPIAMTMARIQTTGINPQNCNDWLSPSWKAPQDWWNGLLPTDQARVVGQAVTGFEINFDTRPGGGCTKFRQDLYRSGFTYTVAASLKGLVTAADISFSSRVLPSGVSPTGMCQPMTAGGGSLFIMNQGAALPAATGGFAYLGTAPAAAFPAAGKVFGMTFPWVPGSIPANGRAVTTVASGLGGAAFTVDVKDFLDAALNSGGTTLSFMLSGSDEAPVTVFPAGAIDCKTVYRFGNLVITHY